MKPAIVTFAAVRHRPRQRLAAAHRRRHPSLRRHGEDGKSCCPASSPMAAPSSASAPPASSSASSPRRSTTSTMSPPCSPSSQDGAHIVPLLGGHHGANRLAREIAEHLGGTAALTTASDAKFTRGLDDPPPGWVLSDPAAAKPAMMALLLGGQASRSTATPLGSPRPATRESRPATVKIRVGEHPCTPSRRAALSPQDPRRRYRLPSAAPPPRRSSRSSSASLVCAEPRAAIARRPRHHRHQVR